MLFSPSHSESYLPIISEMITPAILILAAGSQVNSTLTRLARIVDRTRVLIDLVALARKQSDLHGVQAATSWFPIYHRRVSLVERALTMFYLSIGMFVASSLAITIDHFIPDTLPWLAVALVVIGAIFLLTGTVALVIETHIAAGILRREIEVGTGLTDVV
jgi:Protein of unknown function (DUF2721)